MIDCYKNCKDLRNGVCPPMKTFCPKKLAEHNAELLNKVAEKIDKALTDDDSVYKEISSEWDKGTFMGCVLAVIEEMKAEVEK